MRAKSHFKGSFQRVMKKWGQIITADHLVTNKKGKKHGIHGFKNTVNIKDLWSGLICSFPVKDKGNAEARKAFKFFAGERKIQKLFSDNAGELKAAAEKLGIQHEMSEPGVPVGNCIAERNNGDILNMTKPALCCAGMPACCWPYAAPHACFMENTHWESGKESPYNKTHKKGEFLGLKIPFGARVDFKPNPTRPNDVPGKFEPDAVAGIFGGYEMNAGYVWSKRYYVWAVSDFDGLSLKKNIPPEQFKLREPFRVSQLKIIPGDWQFPLKARYELINTKIEGDEERAKTDQDPVLAPPDQPAADQERDQQEAAPNYAVDGIPRDLDDPLNGLDVPSDDEIDLGDDINDNNPNDGDNDEPEIDGTGPIDDGDQEGSSEAVGGTGSTRPPGDATPGDGVGGTGPTQPAGAPGASTSSSSSSAPPASSSSAGPRRSGKPAHRGKHGEVYVDDEGEGLSAVATSGGMLKSILGMKSMNRDPVS